MSQENHSTKWHPPRIARLSIEGFKSFGSPAEELELGPLNVFVGANASGKTNLLSALRFIKLAVTQNVQHALDEMGGWEEVVNKLLSERGLPEEFTLGVNLDCGGMEVVGLNGAVAQMHEFDYRVRVGLDENRQRPVVLEEKLHGRMVSQRRPGTFSYRLDRNQGQLVVEDPISSPDHPQQFPVLDADASRLALGIGFFSAPCVLLRNSIEGWQFYDLNPDVARLPYRETADPVLGSRGENLSVVLHRLSKENGGLKAVVSSLRGLVPGFEGIQTEPADFEGRRGFRVLEAQIRGGLSPESVSNGTIRLLAFMVIAYDRRRVGSMVTIEEPETEIHPWLLEYVVRVLREESAGRQFFVTTQSPALLDWFSPNEVYMCEKIEGMSHVRHAVSVPDIEVSLEHFMLGDLWTQGVVGAIP